VLRNVSGLAPVSDYAFEVRINDRVIASGTVTGHWRADGWEALVSRLLLQREEVEAEPTGGMHYLVYAHHQLFAAIGKREDAPASSVSHEMAARVALNLERVPTHTEIADAWRKYGDGESGG